MRCIVNIDFKDVINLLQDYDDDHKEVVRTLNKEISRLWTVIRVICREYKDNHCIREDDIKELLDGELPFWAGNESVNCYDDIPTWNDILKGCDDSSEVD